MIAIWVSKNKGSIYEYLMTLGAGLLFGLLFKISSHYIMVNFISIGSIQYQDLVCVLGALFFIFSEATLNVSMSYDGSGLSPLRPSASTTFMSMSSGGGNTRS